MKSGRLYSLVTKYWPRIAAGLVVVIGLVELVVGGLTADSGLEFYLMAWAGTTGGLWFLFEVADKSLSSESRASVAARLVATDLTSAVTALPSQFTRLFDHVFGESHLSWKCFTRSTMASAGSVVVVVVLLSIPSTLTEQLGERLPLIDGPTLLLSALAAIVANTVLDYLSLLETRTFIQWASGPAGSDAGLHLTELGGLTDRARGSQRVWMAVVGDFAATMMMSGLFWSLVVYQLRETRPEWVSKAGGGLPFATAVGFFSSFFTSVWLWLYAASVLVSRVLLKMNGGVGFLLRVTDVENQPFRSMGFVSVLIVSGLFLLGLPFVLL